MGMAVAASLLQVSNLSVRLDGEPVIENLSFSVGAPDSKDINRPENSGSTGTDALPQILPHIQRVL